MDATDESVWKNGTPFERKKYLIKGTVDSVVESKSQELINYISAKNETVNKDIQLDYAYTYFLSAFFQYGAISKSPLTKLYGKDFCQSIDNAFVSALINVETETQFFLIAFAYNVEKLCNRINSNRFGHSLFEKMIA